MAECWNIEGHPATGLKEGQALREVLLDPIDSDQGHVVLLLAAAVSRLQIPGRMPFPARDGASRHSPRQRTSEACSASQIPGLRCRATKQAVPRQTFPAGRPARRA